MITKWIEKMFNHSFDKEWFETYWAIDIHGVVLKPNYRKDHFCIDFYPYAKETLQLLSSRDDIVLIMFTSSYPTEVEYYKSEFKKLKINFKYVNENPEIDSTKGNFGFYDKKFYFNVLMDDKAGFDPYSDWENIYNLLIRYEKEKYKPNPKWFKKY